MSTVEKVVGQLLLAFLQGIFDRSVTSEFKDFLRQWKKIKFDVEVNFLVSRILNPKSAMMLDEAHDEVKQFASVPISGQYWKIALDELESLKQTSDMMQFLSDEAEVKQFTSVAVKVWLDHLKQLLYDADDILDDYATELVRLKFESAHPTQQGFMHIRISPPSLSLHR
ncbi:uncharacterized protein LOC122084321 [Macadamia integrifolia]|uniref:uncharacterized protein LOC122084321 n=1 Tax=Macadamia integrifolia TaxID=60698 RepID=UPI001C4ED172|nr:uncharacterized protein LOC122084321 [Macadamia integrifolia]